MSSMWNMVENAAAQAGTSGPHHMGASSGIASVVSSSLSGVASSGLESINNAAKDPSILLGGGMQGKAGLAHINKQISSALSIGDAQYWEESIAPATVRQDLSNSDPSNPHSTPKLLRCMKWLFANISKGRDVSDFFSHVVKLVGSVSLEVRKMVYMYLVQYADHDATTRELSLLSINSFQKGLGDQEQLIRGLALRVLTSIRVQDILQLQILAVQKCTTDPSPYVRKCAANALAKLHHRCAGSAVMDVSMDDASAEQPILSALQVQQQETLLEMMKQLLSQDTATMVLTSALIAFSELCPERYDMIHVCYRKVCHLLTDMDEWGQIVVIDILTRYCRKFFRQPRSVGSAVAIDQERRVRRTLRGIAGMDAANFASGLDSASGDMASPSKLPPHGPRKAKRRVVRKGFYSDDEEESSEEEVYENDQGVAFSSLSGAMRQSRFGGGNTISPPDHGGKFTVNYDNEDDDLHEDHRLLLRSSLPLLKSRNSGVVLAVCSLHYYCGVASIKIRSALGKALVRIHRDRREVQYVVLTSIRVLVHECPSAFTPFLNDFFVKAMDPSFTRMIKLDILTALALEPPSIEAVLKELRTYIGHEDKKFVCAAVRAVGKVVELARIVHDRHGEQHGTAQRERRQANKVALDALYGVMTLLQACEGDDMIVGECAIMMQRILLQLSSDVSKLDNDDENRVREIALKRIFLLVVRELSARCRSVDNSTVDEDDDEDAAFAKKQMTAAATAAALWLVGEWVAPLAGSGTAPFVRISKVGDKARIRLELVRLIAKSFSEMEGLEKTQAVHFASKLIASSKGVQMQERALCELILSMGRADTNTNVRDRARFESSLIQVSLGLQYDTENLAPHLGGRTLSLDDLKKMLLGNRPHSSHLKVEGDVKANAAHDGNFRFGTLSSLVGYRVQSYLPLPDWAGQNSSTSLRDPPSPKREGFASAAPSATAGKNPSNFYGSSSDTGEESSSESEDSSSSSSSSDSSSEQEEQQEESSSESESSSEDESDDSDDEGGNTPSNNLISMQAPNQTMQTNESLDIFAISTPTPAPSMQQPVPTMMQTVGSSARSKVIVDDASSSEDSDSGDSSDDSDENAPSSQPIDMFGAPSNLLGGRQQKAQTQGLDQDLLGTPATIPPQPMQQRNGSSSSSVISQGLEGLVMAPVVTNGEGEQDPDIERDSGLWIDFVRYELGGGLSVKGRYLRGGTKERQAGLIGLDGTSTKTVILELKFQNRRTDAGILRRVRVVQRSSPSGVIGPRRVILPQEIAALAKNQMTTAILGVEFKASSDKDGGMVARLDIKSDRGSTSVELCPPLGELLSPVKMDATEFDGKVALLKGFQTIKSQFMAGAKKPELLSAIAKHIGLKPIGKRSEWDGENMFRMVGTLPASSDKLFISIYCDKNGIGEFTVCSDNAMAINTILSTLKKAVKSLV